MAGFFLCQYKNISESLAVESSRNILPGGTAVYPELRM